jgi:hypothetical protein
MRFNSYSLSSSESGITADLSTCSFERVISTYAGRQAIFLILMARRTVARAFVSIHLVLPSCQCPQSRNDSNPQSPARYFSTAGYLTQQYLRLIAAFPRMGYSRA